RWRATKVVVSRPEVVVASDLKSEEKMSGNDGKRCIGFVRAVMVVANLMEVRGREAVRAVVEVDEWAGDGGWRLVVGWRWWVVMGGEK
nr:hypothetical protein [Tanacetum cinerariifolium]